MGCHHIIFWTHVLELLLSFSNFFPSVFSDFLEVVQEVVGYLFATQ